MTILVRFRNRAIGAIPKLDYVYFGSYYIGEWETDESGHCRYRSNGSKVMTPGSLAHSAIRYLRVGPLSKWPTLCSWKRSIPFSVPVVK